MMLYLACVSYDHIFRGWKLWKRVEMSVVQVQVNYQTKEWYMAANILQYRSDNLIIFYCCAYSGLLGTMGSLFGTPWDWQGIQGLVLGLMGDGMECDPHWKRVGRVQMLDGMWQLLSYLWYLNLGWTLKGLGVIQKFERIMMMKIDNTKKSM